MRAAGLVAGLLGAIALGATPAAAKPGDLIVAAADEVVRMDPNSGTVTPVATLPTAANSDHAAFGRDGLLYIADDAFEQVNRVNVKTGEAAVFSDAAIYAGSFGLDVAPGGQVLVGDFEAAAIFGLTSPSPSPTTISTGGRLDDINAVAAAPDGAIYGPVINPSAVLRVDPKSGVQEEVAQLEGDGAGGTVAANGIVYVAGDDSVQSYNPRTDSADVLLEGGGFGELYDIDVGFDGKLYVVDNVEGVVHRLDPKTGARSTVGEIGATGAIGIAVEPPRCFGKSATVIGTQKKEKVKGSKGDDVIATLGGKDKVNSKGGNDRICGGKGKDKLKGGKGKDKLKGQGGKDKLNGGPGKDKERQ